MGSYVIPRFEPEVIEASARKLGSIEGAPTTSLESVAFGGVLLVSRRRRADEYEQMAQMVASLTPAQRRVVAGLYCDSESPPGYAATLTVWDDVLAQVIGGALRFASGSQIWVRDVDGVHPALELPAPQARR